VAARSGITESAISALERGARERPYPDTLDRLATALGPSASERDALVQALAESIVEPVCAVTLPPAAAPGNTAVPALRGHPIGLPALLTSFVARERELAVVAGLLAEGHRLLTLTGLGGAGKTRLAIESARAVAHNFTGGVWFVNLAPLPVSAEIAGAVAAALGVREQPERNLDAGIVATLGAGRTLLVLDNCEQVLDSCATLVTRLLQAAPGLTVLTTSREPLRPPAGRDRQGRCPKRRRRRSCQRDRATGPPCWFGRRPRRSSSRSASRRHD
jgi:hypothetical protein